MEAAADNLLISKDGAVSALRGEASELRKRQVKDELARRSRANRITAALTGQSRTAVLEAIRHKKVCVEPDSKSGALTPALRAACLTSVSAVPDAEVFIVKSPGHPNAGVALVSVLRGGYHIAPALMLSNTVGQHGCAVKVQPAMAKPRLLFGSQSCADVQHAFWALVEKVLSSASVAECKTKVRYSTADDTDPDGEWNALKVKYKSRPHQLLAVVRQSELTTAAFTDWKHTYTVAQLVKHLTVIDPAGCVCAN